MSALTPRSSPRFLIGLFLMILPLFIFIRWDSAPWLADQVHQAAASAGYSVQYDKLSLSGLGVSFQQVSIKQGQSQVIQCEQLELSLSLSQLFSGHLGVDVEATWQENAVTLTLVHDGDLLIASNIQGQLDATDLATLQTNIPAKLSGLLAIEGDIIFNQLTQQPQAAHVNITWQQAKAGLTQPEFSLGDYQLQIKSNDDRTQPWRWNLRGGHEVELNGDGTISPQHINPKYWTIQGSLAIDVRQAKPSLMMIFQTIMGGSQASVRLSGLISQPHVETIR